VRSAKFTSPAKFIVNSPGGRVSVGDGAVDVVDPEEGWVDGDSVEVDLDVGAGAVADVSPARCPADPADPADPAEVHPAPARTAVAASARIARRRRTGMSPSMPVPAVGGNRDTQVCGRSQPGTRAGDARLCAP
jgi:hypothetical protein